MNRDEELELIAKAERDGKLKHIPFQGYELFHFSQAKPLRPDIRRGTRRPRKVKENVNATNDQE